MAYKLECSTLVSAAVLLFTSLAAHADPYRLWAGEVSKATKGLEICADAYADAIGNGHDQRERKKYSVEAAKSCGALKIKFDATMLAVRTNVNDLDDVLRAYHQLGIEAFKQLEPKPNQHPLSYLESSKEIILAVSQMHFRLVALDGGR
jgi:hypothetical protein